MSRGCFEPVINTRAQTQKLIQLLTHFSVTFQLVFSAISWANLFSRPHTQTQAHTHTETPPHTAFQIEINMVSYVDIVAQRT